MSAFPSTPVQREYDRLAPEYDRRWRSYIDATLDAVLQVFHPQPGATVLDIACGTGELERRLLTQCPGLRLVGTDISHEMLRQARPKIGTQTSLIRADAARLPFADGAFDHAICANSFHYFPRPLESLCEARRVLRPRGQFILVDWCDDYLSCKLCSVWLRLTDHAFRKTYTLRECLSLLAQAGFEILAADEFRVRWIWGMMRLVCRRR